MVKQGILYEVKIVHRKRGFRVPVFYKTVEMTVLQILWFKKEL